MRHAFVPTLAVFLAAALLAGCGAGPDHEIGSTVKGTRIAVLERSHAVETDKGLNGARPEIPPTVTNANWPQAGYDPAHVMPNAAIADHPQKVWSESIGAGSSSDFKLLARPIVNNGTVFTMDALGLVKAFGTKDGERLWEFETVPPDHDAEAIGGGLGADGDMVYAATGFGEVLALNATHGKLEWRRSLQNPLRAAPTIASGHLYAVSIDNQLSALDAHSGEILWKHNGIAESATLMGASSPAVTGDSVIVAYSSGEIYNLRTENGRVSWNYALTTPTQVGALPAIADIRGLPVIDHGGVFAAGHSGRMAAVDHRTGDRAWEADIGSINTPLVAGDAVFILSNDSQLVALQRTSGRVMWVHALQRLSEPDEHESPPVFWSGPVLGGNHLWLTNSLGQLASFSTDDGKPLETVDIGDPIYIPPVMAGGTIYVVTDDGNLVALR